MQHFRESIMFLKRCDVFVDKRRKSDRHFLCFFQKYHARWADGSNLKFSKTQKHSYFNSAFSLFNRQNRGNVFCGLVEPLMESVHVSRLPIILWELNRNVYLPFSCSANKANSPRLRPFESVWSSSRPSRLENGSKTRDFLASLPGGVFDGNTGDIAWYFLTEQWGLWCGLHSSLCTGNEH